MATLGTQRFRERDAIRLGEDLGTYLDSDSRLFTSPKSEKYVNQPYVILGFNHLPEFRGDLRPLIFDTNAETYNREKQVIETVMQTEQNYLARKNTGTQSDSLHHFQQLHFVSDMLGPAIKRPEPQLMHILGFTVESKYNDDVPHILDGITGRLLTDYKRRIPTPDFIGASYNLLLIVRPDNRSLYLPIDTVLEKFKPQ